MQNEFNYIMVSNRDGGGDFYNTCNETLDFQTNEYEVCMQELILNVGAWDNVRDGSNFITIKPEDYHARPVHLIPNHYPTIQSLVDACNLALRGWGSNLHYHESAKTIEFIRNGGARILQYNFVKSWHIMLGLIPNMNSPIPIINAGDKIDATKIDLYRNTLTMLWVNADFIKPTNVGPYLTNILRMVPIQLSTGQLEHHMFALHYYMPVKRLPIQQFRIEIRDYINGPSLKIGGTTVIPLHFRIKNAE